MKNRTLRTLLMLGAGITAISAQADAVNPAAITEFQAGTPAVAAEVNANFNELIGSINDNAARLTSLETTVAALQAAQPPAGGVKAINVNCATNPAALANAIASADPNVALEITAAGECSEIAIGRDNVSINGPATITSTGAATAVALNSARRIKLTNLAIDGNGTADTALMVAAQSEVRVTDVTISGAVDETVRVLLSSLMSLNGTNVVTGGAALALSAGGQAAVFLESGSTTLTSDSCALALSVGGAMGGPGHLEASGGCVELELGSTLILQSATIAVNSTLVANASNLALTAEGADIVFNSGKTTLRYASTATLSTEAGGSVANQGSWEIGSASTLGAAGSGVTLASGTNTNITAQFNGAMGVDGIDIAATRIVSVFQSRVLLGAATKLSKVVNGGIVVHSGSTYFSFAPAIQTTDTVNCPLLVPGDPRIALSWAPPNPATDLCL